MKPLARNFLAASGADAGSRFLGFLVTAYLARVLGPSSFGLMSIGLSVLGYASLFAGPGLNVYGTRLVASTSEPARGTVRKIVATRTLLGIASAAVFAAGAFTIYGASMDWVTVTVFAAGAIPMAATADWFLQGKNAIGSLAVARLAMYGSYLLFVVLLVQSPADTVWSGVAFVAAACVMAAMTLLSMARHERRGPMSPSPPATTLMRESVPLGLSAILAQTVANLPVLIVGAVLSTTDAGIFGSAMKLVFFALMLDRVFYLLFLPVASRAAASPDQLSRLVEMGLKVVLSIAFPVTVMAIAFSHPLTVLVYGNHFAPAAPVFAAAMPYFAFTVVSTVMMTTLYATHREKTFLGVLAVGTLVLVTLCAILTVTVGTVGSALGLSAGELLMAVLLTIKVRAYVPIHVMRTVVSSIAGAAAMGAVVMLLHTVPLPVQACAGTAVFFGTVFLLKGLTRQDVIFVREKFA